MIDNSGARPMDLNGSSPLRLLQQSGSSSAPGESQPGPGEDSFSVQQYWETLRESRRLLVCCGVIGALAGLVVTILTPVQYDSRTTLEMQSVNESFMNMNQIDPQATGENLSTSSSNLQTQLQILASTTLKRQVMSDVKALPIPIESGSFVTRLRISIGLEPKDPKQRANKAIARAVGSARASIVKGTRIIEITCSSTSPRIAAAVLNTMTKRYIAGRVEARLRSAQETARWLTDRLEEARKRLDDSEDRLEALTRKGAQGAGRSPGLSKARQNETQIALLHQERVEKEVRYQTALNASPDVLGEITHDDKLRPRRQQIESLQAELARLLRIYTPAHEKVQRIQLQLSEAESALENDRALVLAALKSEVDEAKRKEQLAIREFNSFSSVEDASGPNVLRREVETNRQMYGILLTQLNQTSLATNLPTNSIRIVDVAQAPGSPSTPQTGKNLGLGGIGGLLLACLGVFVRDQFNNTVRSPGHSLSLLNVPELGVIPSVPAGASHLARASGTLAGSLSGSLSGLDSDGVRRIELAAWTQSGSLLAESFRVALASLMFESKDRPRPRRIVVTSPGKGEGKTTIASNLSIAMASANRRVLIIDGDLRAPRLHIVLDADNSWGLPDLLESDRSPSEYAFEELCQPTRIPGLYILTAGQRRENNANILYSPRLVTLFDRLEREFDIVLVDSPPMIEMADARILGRNCDGALLVLRSGVTARMSALEARRLFDEDATPILGTILNDWRPPSRVKKRYGADYYSTTAEKSR